MKKILTISGSDCSGGAGIQADIKAVSSRGDFISSVVTAVVAENTKGVRSLNYVDSKLVYDQIEVIFDDMGTDAIKLGMLPSADIIKAIYEALKDKNIKNVVFDPCMVTKSEDELVEDDSIRLLKEYIFPMVDLICPNIPEAKTITGLEIKDEKDMEEACKIIYDMGVKNVLVKGGSHIDSSVDILYNGVNFERFSIKRIDSKNTQGTGDVLAAIIASNLAHALNISDSISNAKKYVTTAIETAPGIGEGFGILNFFHEIYK
ncbi:MAG: bifunctional hydroxymethylpyrimidine kinase/phosphomethylpyrimidine kinase [Tissierellia bacterium]|nr:bifunctional hydroxymethylpyrimidine kinase/phosphomethylpyrimidine kinase [Tissierellia bacterium]